MPADRFFHPRLGHSAKVNSLTDFEELVWRQYILSADDFGIMRFSAITIQADHDRLAARPQKAVQKALERIRDVGLVQTFEHQGRTYCYQHDWQNYQRVKHPRQTINPKPPDAAIEECSSATRKLFSFWPGKSAKKDDEESDQDSGNTSVAFPPLARAGTRETATAKANGSGNGSGRSPLVEDELAERAGRFCERYAELFAEHRRGARYYPRPALDFEEACRLCATWDDARLERLVEAFFTTDDPFCRDGSGTIKHFASRASWCDGKLKAAGL
jgi:hypothetical protein